MRRNIPVCPKPDDGDPLDPARGMCWGLVVCVTITILAWIVLSLMCERAEAGTFEQHARAAIADPTTPEVKRELFRHALVHRCNLTRFDARVVYYHPREAGSAWERWSRTATGTLVRPGVASCTVAHRSEWLGAWIWFAGHGLCKVEDVFPESRSRTMFDLAVWARPGQTYQQWLWDPTRVVIARTRNVRTEAVVVKPKGGWEQ